ncbi:unnamed protein product [Discosporangium mesarthrocarpum]
MSCPTGDEMQREGSDGHFRAHGLAFQGIILPRGMFLDVRGPFSGRRHDAYLLRGNQKKKKLAPAQGGSPIWYKVYGDAAYPVLSHVDRGFRGANLTPAQREYNKHMSLSGCQLSGGSARLCRKSLSWTFRKT